MLNAVGHTSNAPAHGPRFDSTIVLVLLALRDAPGLEILLGPQERGDKVDRVTATLVERGELEQADINAAMWPAS